MFRNRFAIVRTAFAERKTRRGLAWIALRDVKPFRTGLRASGNETDPLISLHSHFDPGNVRGAGFGEKAT